MKKMKILTSTILVTLGLCAALFLIDKTLYSNWYIKNSSPNKTEISWTKFTWINQTLNGKYYEKTAMLIPCKIEGIENNATFQFDLGSGYTGIYENTYSSFYKVNPKLKNKIKRLKSNIQFWNKNKYFENLKLQFGNYTATNKVAYVFKDYGRKVKNITVKDTIHLGTVGADIFKNKILIIDYPNKQFAICDKIPENYAEQLIDIKLDKYGKIILPLKKNGKNYEIMFDNGSSLFPLITSAKNISNFSNSPDIDTIQISSWGKTHGVTGKIIKDTFQLAGQNYVNVKIYANHSGLGIAKNTDGMAGNALFWDNTIIIDFKNKKFGIRRK